MSTQHHDVTIQRHRSTSKYPPGRVTELPKVGRLTFESEGHEGGRWHSRVLSVPSDTSGLTLGRGYDMGKKPKPRILQDLVGAGVPVAKAKLISDAAGKHGKSAQHFIEEHKIGDFEITQLQQRKLFEITYSDEARDVERISKKADVVSHYGAADWAKIDPTIRDIVVDIKYRGDYTGASRAKIQKHIVDNDIYGLAEAMKNRENWKNVPLDRFNARVSYLQTAIEERAKADKNKSIPITLR